MMVLSNTAMATTLKSWIIVAAINLFCFDWIAAASLTQASDSGDGSERPLAKVSELVFRVQQIYIKYDCPYEDPDGVCSPGSRPDCKAVINQGACVLNSCERQSETDRATVADLLAQIGSTTNEVCGLTGEILLKAANGQTTLHSHSWVVFLISAFGVLVTTIHRRLISC